VSKSGRNPDFCSARARRVRNVGADATGQAARGPGSAGATGHGAGRRLYEHRRSQSPRGGADTARHAAVDRYKAELTVVEKEITRTGTAIDRYLTAFENNTLDPALLQDRLTALRAKTAQLQTRRDELAELLSQAPAMPPDNELDVLADHIDQILDHGAPAQRKALVEQLVEEIQIIGPSQIRPIYRVPRRGEGTEPAPGDEPTVRTMGNLVVLSASEIGSFVFCPEAWYLERAGATRSRAGAQRLQAGIDAHRQIGRRTDNLRAFEWLRQVLLAAILVLVVIVAAQFVSGRGVFRP
jgi:hypothetical protein